MDETYDDQIGIGDNTDVCCLDTLVDDVTNMDLQTEKLLPDETMGFPDAESPVISGASCGTLKEYEDQLAALRKDNFNLKLRIYFLEERLQNPNAPQSHDDLYKKNLELKVKVGSLTRELKDHKELLRSAAEAMEFTEQASAKKEADLQKHVVELKLELEKLQSQQHGMALECEDSVALYTEAFNLNNYVQPPKLQVNDKTVESSNSSKIEDNDASADSAKNDKAEMEKLNQENAKLYKLLQECLERIRRTDKTEQRQKESLQRKEERIAALQKELKKAIAESETASQSSQEIENKYKDLLSEKDEKITNLETRLNKLNIGSGQGDGPLNCGNQNMSIQEMLTKRLREMAYFLDSLISHRCVIGEEKQKRIESLLEESLRLPIDLELDPEASRILETSLMDNTLGDKSINMLELTKLLGHHVSLDDTLQHYRLPHIQEQATQSDADEIFSFDGSKHSMGDACNVGDIDNSQLKTVMLEKEAAVQQLVEAKSTIADLETKCENINRDYHNAVNNKKQIEELYQNVMTCQNQLISSKENNDKLIAQLQSENRKLQDDKTELMQNFMSKIEAETHKWKNKMEEQREELICEFNNLKYQHEQLEDEFEEMKRSKEEMDSQLVEIEQRKEELAKREEELKRQEELMARDMREDAEEHVGIEGEGFCPSPDQGIDSDRHSSLELPDAYSSQDEILALRTQLKETERKLEAALHKLTPLQLRHHKVERAICKQIHKTTAVLREAKKNFNVQ